MQHVMSFLRAVAIQLWRGLVYTEEVGRETQRLWEENCDYETWWEMNDLERWALKWHIEDEAERIVRYRHKNYS